MISAMLAGIGLSLYKQYSLKGYLSKSNYVVVVITLTFGVVVAITVAWWANKPEKENNK